MHPYDIGALNHRWLNRSQRRDYIFKDDPKSPVVNRFNWIEGALLGDIQTFVDGIQDLVAKKRMPTSTEPRGSGNVSLPILVNTGLELVSAMHAGATKYRGRGYSADENVASFVKAYFPGNSKLIARIMWDSTRNGLTHLFSPKVMRRRNDYILFTFYVQDSRIKSKVVKDGKTIVVWFNSIEYYHVLKKAVADYKAALLTDRQLQIKFIRAWKSIERHVKNLDQDQMKKPEADFLRKTLRTSNEIELFQ